jgi:hypothetical protein
MLDDLFNIIACAFMALAAIGFVLMVLFLITIFVAMFVAMFMVFL